MFENIEQRLCNEELNGLEKLQERINSDKEIYEEDEDFDLKCDEIRYGEVRRY